MVEFLKDFPPGPLDYYRQKASFDWKQLKLFLYGEKQIALSHKVYEEMYKYPEFHPPNRLLSFDEERHLAFKQSAIFRSHEKDIVGQVFSLNMLLNEFSFQFSLDFPSASLKYILTLRMFMDIIQNTGDERHEHFLEATRQGKISGCFCLTEVGHGSNVKGMRTRATYDRNTKEFVIHTPDFQAAKCWIGGLGNTATHVLLYCQLYLENKKYGLHSFVVPIRDPNTLLPYPGVTVGDIGEKIGLNGLDNGFLLFNNYRIPRENILNRNGDVTEDGQYVTPIQDENRRFAESLAILSTSRVGVMSTNTVLGGQALTIAIRYAGVRKQFGNENEETPILEYQSHQYRLLPYLAAVYVFYTVGPNLSSVYKTYLENPQEFPNLEFVGIELHIITSAAKPVSGWLMRDAIQSCRECCGGHGYLKAAGLGERRGNQDATNTYEGDGWVLIQQVGNALLKLWESINSEVKITSPLKSVDFLNNAKTLLKTGKFSSRTVEELCHPQSILQIYQWLTCFLLKQTYERQDVLMKSGATKLSAKNDTQVYYGRKLAIAYIEHFFLQQFLEKVLTCPDVSMQFVLKNLFALYGLFSLEKFIAILYQGGFASGEKPVILIQDSITELLSQLKNEAVALVDVISPPDFVLNSVLGASDGQVYHHLEKAFFNSPYGTRRPTWWKDVVNWKDIFIQSKSKL